MPTNDEATFKITNTKLYVPIVTLSSKDNTKLVKLLEDGFERPAYQNEYQTKIKTKDLDNDNPIRLLFDSSFQGIKRLFVLAFNNTTATIPENKINSTVNKVERNNHRKYFLPKVIDGRNFYDQPINDMIKQYDGITKIETEQGDDYTTRCLLDYQYFRDHHNLIAIDLIRRKEFSTDSREIQQIKFYGMLKTNSQVCTVLEKSKETIPQFSKGTAKVL